MAAGGRFNGSARDRGPKPGPGEAGRIEHIAVKTQDNETLVWRQPDGSPIVCEEKLKVLNENLSEVRQVCQDALEDAVLMGCDEKQIRRMLRFIVDSLDNPFRAPDND